MESVSVLPDGRGRPHLEVVFTDGNVKFPFTQELKSALEMPNKASQKER